MQQKLGKWSLRFTEAPFILESSSVVGTKEAEPHHYEIVRFRA